MPLFRSAPFMLVVLLSACAAPEEQAPPPPTEAPTVSTGTPSLFADPARFCNALTSEGLSPLPRTNWTNVEDSGYYCGSDSIEITPGNYSYVGDLPNTVSYYVESASPQTVDWARITGNIFNEQNEGPVLARMGVLGRALFAGLGLEPHEEALAALAEQRASEFETDYGVVRVERDDTYNMGHGVRLVIDGR